MQVVTKKYYLFQTFLVYINFNFYFLIQKIICHVSHKVKGKVKRSFPLNMLKSKILLQKWHLWSISFKMTPILSKLV